MAVRFNTNEKPDPAPTFEELLAAEKNPPRADVVAAKNPHADPPPTFEELIAAEKRA